jgi:type II secretory pathway pseudopilin PulG
MARADSGCFRTCRAGVPPPAESGFTLIEVLAAIAVTVLALGMMILPFMSALDYLGKGRARSESQQTARQVIDTMARELTEAMDIQLASPDPGVDGTWGTADDVPRDPAICAFVPAQPNTYPLQPSDTVVRYWQVWRSDPNADPADGSPDGTSWYDKFNPDPRYNQASDQDTDSRFIARSELAGPLGDASVDRTTPAAADPPDPVQDKQNFVALSPAQISSDVPVLRFDPVPQVQEALKRDSSNAYVFHSRYPLWEPDWVVHIYFYDDTGTLEDDVEYDTTTDPGYVGTEGARRGEVNLAVSQDETTEDPTYPLVIVAGVNTSTIELMTAQPDSVIPDDAVIVPGTVRVVAFQGGVNADPLALTEIPSTATPVWGQFRINNPANMKDDGLNPPPEVEINNDSLPLGTNTPVEITYQWTIFNPATDRIIATYSTRALINITLTVSQRDSKTGQPQDVQLVRRVKLKNVLR